MGLIYALVPPAMLQKVNVYTRQHLYRRWQLGFCFETQSFGGLLFSAFHHL